MKIANKLRIKSLSVSAQTGTERILRSDAMKATDTFDRVVDEQSHCNKDTEGLSTMNTYSRGHLFFVHPCGIIRYWAPLYRSEDPTQVSLPTIKFCSLIIQVCTVAMISTIFLFYDNMCNLERLKLWDCNPKDFTKEARLGFSVFNRINKGVDALHIKNHVRVECRNEYPKVIENLRSTFERPNTEAAEQTFVWLGRFKRLLNSMSKRKHHFFLHSLVRERNEYTEWCFSLNITPKLPQARGDKLMVAPVD